MVNDQFTFKLYEDVVVFYSVMAGVVLLGSIAHFHTGLRTFLQRLVPVFRHSAKSTSAFSAYLAKVLPRYISLGEILVLPRQVN